MNKCWGKIQKFILNIKGLSVIAISDIIASAISSIFWLFMASILGAENYGQINYFISIAAIASSLSILGSDNTLFVYTAKKIRLESTIYFITLISGVIASIILFLIFYNLEMSVLSLGYVIFGLAGHEILGRKLYATYSKFLITQRILMIVLSLGLYYILGSDGVLLGLGLAFFPYLIRIFKGFKETKIDFSLLKPRMNFMMNSYIMKIMDAFSGSVDKLIIAPLLGFVILGNYQLGIQFLSLLEILPAIAYKYTLPHDATGNSNIKLKKIIVIGSAGMAALGIIGAPIILPVVFPQYVESIGIIQIMSLAVIPASITYMYTSKFLGTENSKIVLLSSGTYFVVSLIGILILSSIYGINGAAVSLVIATTSQMCFLILAGYFLKNKK